MSAATVIDSSVWIELVRGQAERDVVRRAKALLDGGEAALCPPVWLELYQGIRTKRDEANLHLTRSLCRWLAFDERCWNEAAILARAVRRGGICVPLGDVLVFACARAHGAELLHNDRHFEVLAKICVD